MTIIAGLSNFVPMISQWKLQSKDDIYDSFDDWDYHTFICIMKDGKEARAHGIADEGYEGSCSKYVSFEDDDYEIDDIVYWLEIPTPPKTDTLKAYKEDKVQDFIKSSRAEFLKVESQPYGSFTGDTQVDEIIHSLASDSLDDIEKKKDLKLKVENLESQIRAMRCCGNCEHREDCVYEWAWDLCEKWSMYKNGISSDAKRS